MNKQAERALDSLEYADWPLAARIKLGAALIKFLLETAAWSESGRPAFVHEIRSTHVKRRHGVIAMNEAVYSKVSKMCGSIDATSYHYPDGDVTWTRGN